LDGSVSTMLENWSGNEYLFSSAIVRYVEATDDTFGGRRIFAHMSARIVPHSLWPTKYADVVSELGLNIDLTRGAGIPVDRIATITGWDIAVGAAPSFVGDFCLEFGYFAPLAIFAVGFLYGRLWKLSRSDPRVQPAYVLLAALSIYLLTQTIEAWMFRALLFGLPALIILRIVARQTPTRAPYRYRQSA
ncbi:MAG: oligosaccharide repeat unit polymerase, partial [Hyphomicrobium denitrificans]|nr:oligosaccharide repeat unit polymerase [Hyphomicrobium denitrificans]